jgi:N12 class adenine-specific DNA methylase
MTPGKVLAFRARKASAPGLGQESLFSLTDPVRRPAPASAPPAPTGGSNFRPRGQEDLAPAGQMAKARANLRALDVLIHLQLDGRPATLEEQQVLAGWSGWGSLSEVFDEAKADWADIRAQVRERLSDKDWAAAKRSTTNAHYTDAGVVTELWIAAANLGFRGGRVIEPGCGSGNFIGLAPNNWANNLEFVGIELDPTTAAIAKALYPQAHIRAEGFEKSRFPDDSFDLGVGNVPFADVKLHDPVDNRGHFSIHNHFLYKALRLVRPGGLWIGITSRFTMDSRNPGARRAIADRADLVGAVRLPAGTMQAAAGTQAIMDILILRRREEGRFHGGAEWDRSVQVAVADGDLEINEYFEAHPERILGELRATQGQYSDQDLDVRPTGELRPKLHAALAGIVAEAKASKLVWVPGNVTREEAPIGITLSGVRKEGQLLREGAGFLRVTNGQGIPFECKPAKDAWELRSLIGIRDALQAVLEAEASGAQDEVCDAARDFLNTEYDYYYRTWGPLNRFTLRRTGRIDPETQEPQVSQIRPAMGRFRLDPDARSVLALEEFDPDIQVATKAPIFFRRVIVPVAPRHGADTADEALAISLDELGKPDLDRIAELLGVETLQARAELGDLVWEHPGTDDLFPQASYISGNVRRKLAEAEAAARKDQRWEANVAILRGALPPTITAEEIDARPGAPFIPASDVKVFMKEVLHCEHPMVEYVPLTATWTVAAEYAGRHNVASTSEYGTRRANAVDILEAACNQTSVKVYDTFGEPPDTVRVLNKNETLAAMEKQEALSDRFAKWVWERDDRKERLVTLYNDLFNSTAIPRYDGSHMTFPGMAASFVPHEHQKNSCWRAISEPTDGLFHAVGGGKTATMVMTAMEMRRLGMVNKPVFIIPNHMVEQFCGEFYRLYPLAKLHVLDKEDSTRDGRKSWIARAAMGDWDACLITHSAFTRLPVSIDTQVEYLERMVEDFEDAIHVSNRGDGLSVKRLEKSKQRLNAKIEALLKQEGKDDGMCWEHTGIDYFFVDEAHYFKNVAFPTHIRSMGGEGSQRAMDLDLKLWYHRQKGRRKVCTFATATPIANTIAEMWVVQHYLQPEALLDAGIQSFDGWAALFARQVTNLELAPDGKEYRIHSRMARFANVPELLAMWGGVADVRTTEQMKLKVPLIAGGKPQPVVVPASEGLKQFVDYLVARAKRIREGGVRPWEDNMLAVVGDGRKAALDLRLVSFNEFLTSMRQLPPMLEYGEVEYGQPLPPDPLGGKIEACADKIADIFYRTRNNKYLNPFGAESPKRGALQVVFCDLSTPKVDRWNAYDELRRKLVRRGIPADRIRYMQDAKDDLAKARLFADCREGRVSVLMGSTSTMGIGTNVQTRLVALHHLDAPWRPADIEQRDGRAIRQGNQNAVVDIFRYVTEASFDVYMWQLLEIKARFIHQILSGQIGTRVVDDIDGEVTLSFAEIKALATGNPLILEQAGVNAEIAKMQRSRVAHGRDQSSLGYTIKSKRDQVAVFENRLVQLVSALSVRQDTRGEAFTMMVDGIEHATRPAAANHLKELIVAMVQDARNYQFHTPREVGTIAGFPLMIGTKDGLGAYRDPLVSFILEGAGIDFFIKGSEIKTSDSIHLVTRLETKLRSMEGQIADLEEKLAQYATDIEAAQNRFGRPFEHELRLAELLRRQKEINEALMPKEEEEAS